MKERPVITPRIQRVSITYFLARILVERGVKRFHRIDVLSGMDNFPEKKRPFIMVGNHQNGMMDALNICGFTSRQFHWLTRADVFWNPLVRKILLGFNQLPIYRQRDRLTDLRERNDIIWNSCIDRMEIGAPMALFPEGNHNPQRSIRDLKRGVSDLIGRAYTRHRSLDRMLLIPLGQDYEEYPSFRRRLALRVGEPIEWIDLYDSVDQTIDHVLLNKRISEALQKLTVNIQPASEYGTIEPYVRALRATEKTGEDWAEVTQELDRIKASAENDAWLLELKERHEALIAAGYENSMRPEAWGVSKDDSGTKNPLVYLLKPVGWLANLPSAVQHYLLEKKGNAVKKIEFRSTFKVGAGIFLLPITWTIMASIVAWLLSSYEITSYGIGFVGFWAWATWGNKFYGKLTDFYNDHEDAVEGEGFWSSDKMSNLREAWTNYIDAIKS